MRPHPFPHPFDGTPDMPCERCGFPDYYPIHKGSDGRMLTAGDPYGMNRPADVAMKATWVRCGNCKKQYEVPIEQPWRYMAVQQHKFACPAGSPEAVAAQHAQLVAEFEAQQSKKPARRWFEFWRWFE